MANNYTQFSFGIPNLTPKEIQWTQQYLGDAGKLLDEETPLPTKPDHFLRAIKENGYLGFDWSIGDTDQFLWIRSDESGSPYLAAEFVMQFLMRHRPKQCVTFAWADTCSKLRLDEFGGGACVITAKHQAWMSTHQFLSRHRRRLKKRGIVEVA